MTVHSSADPGHRTVRSSERTRTNPNEPERVRASRAASENNHARAVFQRVFEVALYAPVGAAVVLGEQLPKRARRRRQALENRVQLARFIGQLAVRTGQREIAKRIAEQRLAKQAAGAPELQDAHVVGIELTNPPVSSRPKLAIVADTAGAAEVAPAAGLPIRDYESLAAINVVERLRGMRPDEVESIRQFEVAHRSRRTILAKIDQLQQR